MSYLEDKKVLSGPIDKIEEFGEEPKRHMGKRGWEYMSQTLCHSSKCKNLKG